MVYEKKAILFLSSEVIDQPFWGQSKKNEQKTLSFQTIQTKYLTALMYMYEVQKFTEQNHHLSSAEAVLKTLMESLKRIQMQSQWDAFENWALDSLLNSYNMADMQKVISTMWDQTFTSEQYLWTTAFFLVSHFILLWGESLWITELSDLFVIDFDNEGSQCKFMILIKDNEKINSFKKVEHCALMQNKEPLLCDISALAHYFF